MSESEGNPPDDTPENSNADVTTERDASGKKSNARLKKAAALTKISGQSWLKWNKWILMFPAILFNQLLSCG